MAKRLTDYLLESGMQIEGYKIMPPMDPKYVERDGLEGPFTTLSGKVVYYDPKEGKYYDPDTDMYLSYDEFQQYDTDYSGMKDERDEVKEAQLQSFDWPDEDKYGSEMQDAAYNAIRHNMHAYDAFDHVYSMTRDHRDWLDANRKELLKMFADYGLETESVNEADTEGTYARIIYDYSEDWASIDIYKNHEKVDEWDDYFGANETGNPLATKFVEMAKENGLDPMTLQLVDENGDIGTFDGKRFKWEDGVSEEIAYLRKLAGLAEDDYTVSTRNSSTNRNGVNTQNRTTTSTNRTTGQSSYSNVNSTDGNISSTYADQTGTVTHQSGNDFKSSYEAPVRKAMQQTTRNAMKAQGPR